MNHATLSINEIAESVSITLRYLGVTVLALSVVWALARRAGYRLVRGNSCFDIKANAKENENADTSKIRNALRCLKVMIKLIYLAVKFYLLAWFYIPRSFLMAAKAPKTLDELEYDAKNSPAFLIINALFAINLSFFLIYALYIIPVEMFTKHF